MASVSQRGKQHAGSMKREQISYGVRGFWWTLSNANKHVPHTLHAFSVDDNSFLLIANIINMRWCSFDTRQTRWWHGICGGGIAQPKCLRLRWTSGDATNVSHTITYVSLAPTSTGSLRASENACYHGLSPFRVQQEETDKLARHLVEVETAGCKLLISYYRY